MVDSVFSFKSKRHIKGADGEHQQLHTKGADDAQSDEEKNVKYHLYSGSLKSLNFVIPLIFPLFRLTSNEEKIFPFFFDRGCNRAGSAGRGGTCKSSRKQNHRTCHQLTLSVTTSWRSVDNDRTLGRH